jgi:UPF0755 protein
MFKCLRRVFLWMVLLAVAAGAAAAWWLHQPVVAEGAPSEAFVVPPGASARQVAAIASAVGRQSAQPTAIAAPTAWWLLLRFSGSSRSVKTGEYEAAPGDTPLSLLRKLVNGEQVLRQLTIVEGWTFRQVLQALQKEKRLTQQIPREGGEISQNFVAKRLGTTPAQLEGRFFPDTYRFATGQSDVDILKAAANAMDKQLAAAWATRPNDSVLHSPEEALILASIVEKETGHPGDRGQISGVFHNRLRIGMRLQTDPTVIYGLGARFDGNLRKVDLQTDTPFNTYTRAGLPPTPIAMPGKAALEAAVKPDATNAMYFVARGDGTSQFSATLAEHNRAVDKFIRGR